MKKIKLISYCLLGLVTMSCSSGLGEYGQRVEQVSISRVDSMPNIPHTYNMLNWNEKAKAFDAYAFDWNRTDEIGPIIWLDESKRNVNQSTFGLYTAIKDARQGKHVNGGEFHESLNTLAAILGGGLVGINKTNQDGYNYVKMVQNYFNSGNGWNIVMNNTSPEVAKLGGGYGRDWWYDVFPNALYYAVCDVFPNVEGADDIQRSIAEQFVKADSILNGNYDYSFFDYGQMKGVVNNIPLQQDAAGGHAYVLLSAYRKFGDERYLKHAKSAIEALLNQKESRFYEILLPLGVYAAANLNATEGTTYDVQKLLDWTFDGCTNEKARYGWGILVGEWDGYEVNGLQGSITDGGGYAFFMNSVKPAWPFVSMVKYEPQYAKAIGKWMLNNANACRLFYPMEIEDNHQWAPQLKNVTNNNIAYEGFRRYETLYNKESFKDVEGVAIGDGPLWNKDNPTESMFSVYSTSPVGIFGALISETNVEGILQLDCNATDFYAERPYPVHLYYNPYATAKEIAYSSSEAVDLFDIVSKKYVAENILSDGKFELKADNAAIIVALPAGTKLTLENNRVVAEGKHIVAYK